MNHVPSVRAIREAFLEQARQTSHDPIALEQLRANVLACVQGIRRGIDRASDFSQRGLLSEATGLIEDFPDLVRQAQALAELPNSDPVIRQLWTTYIDIDPVPLPLPTQDEVEGLANLATSADSIRAQLDALRVAVLRGEPVSSRLKILRKLRAADSRNRMWLDQIEGVEQEWLKQISNLRGKADATREELDEALGALEANEWIATVPRGLKEEIYLKVKPLRAEEAVGRYADLADRIHAASARMDREELLALEAEWSRVNQETGRMPDNDLAQSVAPAFEWLSKLDRAEREQAEFDRQVEVLEQLLQSRRPIVEIERQIAVLRDAALSAPDGLLDRAMSYVEGEKLKAKRRHRLVVISAVLAAIVLGVVGVFALQAHNESQERAREVTTLRALNEKGDVYGARELAQAIRARGGELTSQVQAEVAVADKKYEARLKLTEQVRKNLEELEGVIQKAVDRKRLVALKAQLADLRKDAEEKELRAIDQTEALRVARLTEVESQIEAAAKKSRDTSRLALESWPVPDRWTNEQQLDQTRWREYLEVLEAQREAIRSAASASDGLDSVVAELLLDENRIQERMQEAQSRSKALADFHKERTELWMVQSSVGAMTKRWQDFTQKHSALLARDPSLQDALSKAIEFKNALDAVAEWSETTIPALLPAIDLQKGVSEDPEIRERARRALEAFRQKYASDHPYGAVIDRFMKLLQQGALARKWGSQDFLDALLKARYADFEEVPLREKRRFYRRPALAPNPAPEKLNPLNRAIESIADFTTDPEKLRAILSVKRDDIEGKAETNSISRIWKRAQVRLETVKVEALPELVLEVLSELRADTSSDVLLRFAALRDYVDVLLRSGQIPPPVQGPLKEWRERLIKRAEKALSADWPKAGWDDPINHRTARSEAEFELRTFPDTVTLIRVAEQANKEAAAELKAVTPVGMLKYVAGSAVEREFIGSAGTGTLMVLVKQGVAWQFVPISIVGGKLQPGPQLPLCPLIVFKYKGEQ